jgi:hypothetical protein
MPHHLVPAKMPRTKEIFSTCWSPQSAQNLPNNKMPRTKEIFSTCWSPQSAQNLPNNKMPCTKEIFNTCWSPQSLQNLPNNLISLFFSHFVRESQSQISCQESQHIFYKKNHNTISQQGSQSQSENITQAYFFRIWPELFGRFPRVTHPRSALCSQLFRFQHPTSIANTSHNSSITEIHLTSIYRFTVAGVALCTAWRLAWPSRVVGRMTRSRTPLGGDSPTSH